MTELRRDAVTGRWVSLAPGRADRPESAARVRQPPSAEELAACPFCPGHEDRTPREVAAIRGDGPADGPGWEVRVVPNLYPAFTAEDTPADLSDPLHERGPAYGACEVIIHSPDHSRWLPYLAAEQAEAIGRVTWERYRRHAVAGVGAVVPFYNHGRDAGASLAHPHGQLFSTRSSAPVLDEEFAGAEEHRARHHVCVFCAMVEAEERAGDRVIASTPDYLAFCPWASRSPFECWIVPRRHLADFGAVGAAEAAALFTTLRTVLWRTVQELGEVPLNWYIHSLPNPVHESADAYHWHLEVRPKLAEIAGFELGTGIYINTFAPEAAAEILRAEGEAPPEAMPPPGGPAS